MSQVRNTNATYIGTGEVQFSPGATSVADARAKGYVDLGNIVQISKDIKNERVDHEGSYRGVKRTDKSLVTKSDFIYKITCDEIDQLKLLLFLLGTEGTAFTQSALAGVAGTALGFTANPAVLNRWYDILDASGNRVRNITSVTITDKVEGTDFELDKKTGRIRFLTAQAADLTPTITSPAITSSDVGYLKAIDPISDTIKTGFARLMVFDNENANELVYDHVDFSCEITVEGTLDVDGKKVLELVLNMRVTDTKGTIYHKN